MALKKKKKIRGKTVNLLKENRSLIKNNYVFEANPEIIAYVVFFVFFVF